MPATRLHGSRHLRARPFCATVLLVAILTAASFVGHWTKSRPRQDVHGHGPLLLTRNDKPVCSQIHLAEDQCAFVKRYCSDDDAGLFPYLELYFCSNGASRSFVFLILVIWLALLFTTIGIAASDFFSVNLSTISSILGLSQSLAGVTFLAFGNGSPDVFSTFAAMSSGSPSMAVGELLGAASFITGVVAGSMALVREFRVDRKSYTRDILFFIVAVGFTMAFLADGRLHFWECWAMVGYYVVYVMAVVGWHWYATRRRNRRRREADARSHFSVASRQPADDLASQAYRDDPAHLDQAPANTDPCPQQRALAVDLESQADMHAHCTLEDHRRMVAAEVTRNMRVLRLGSKSHHSVNPIRPSLVGALEFRSALAQLRRESNVGQSPSPARRSLSENHVGTRSRSETTSLLLHAKYQDAVDGQDASPCRATAGRRERALSSGDTPLSLDALPDMLGSDETRDTHARQNASPAAYITIGGNLAPPSVHGVVSAAGDGSQHEASSRPRLQIPSRSSSFSDTSPPATPFPRFTDSPVAMTPNSGSEHEACATPVVAGRPDSCLPHLQAQTTWWPHGLLPPPRLVAATLFPTLQGWRAKSPWDKCLSAISMPSIFLLVITLPIVDTDPNDDDNDDDDNDDDNYDKFGPDFAANVINSCNMVEPPPAITVEPGQTAQAPSSCQDSGGSQARVNKLADVALDQGQAAASQPCPTASITNANNESQSWNRWLVCLQLFTGPLFAVTVLWANISEDWEQPGRELVRMVVYTLIFSLALLALLLLTTKAHVRPRLHYLFCFMGFIISIAWISTVAGEVVGVLKAFGIILAISEALLGLTIFAAGNSIGDLVADITVARLGYPVMALSACFGGPMLNILIGIGVGGIMMMVQDANHSHGKHPQRPLQYGPYHVQVGGTLMVSSITLLIMLVLLLVVVPLNKWILSRKIGWMLIALWTISTIVSVVGEMTGSWEGEAI
ncbi:hypothetical protein CDD82_1887 [Ophiocordyceps australis]|uniref:Sodium/calcium exchanger membrane region domain-containing protein n=1 Tax=Ophiocordyceps australis TaxID=1399860 RepID=A0A2C5Y9C2_9HYPO|nr:hypothetical protein CDD82_1887 [Ophiocordyceps australis]